MGGRQAGSTTCGIQKRKGKSGTSHFSQPNPNPTHLSIVSSDSEHGTGFSCPSLGAREALPLSWCKRSLAPLNYLYCSKAKQKHLNNIWVQYLFKHQFTSTKGIICYDNMMPILFNYWYFPCCSVIDNSDGIWCYS